MEPSFSTLTDPASAAKPASLAAAAPAAAPSASATPKPKRPAPAPATRQSSVGLPGRKACPSSSQSSLPPVWENRWTLGVQPPDIKRQSQATQRPRPGSPQAATGLTRTAETRSRPFVPVTVPPSTTSMPSRRASARRWSSTFGRTSMMTATPVPARARSKAASQAESFEVTTAARSPTRTP